jgi:hypothetical protein
MKSFRETSTSSHELHRQFVVEIKFAPKPFFPSDDYELSVLANELLLHFIAVPRSTQL